MILKALYDYYNRCGNLPARGTEFKEIGYLIVLSKDGTFLRIESRMLNKKQASSFLVLQAVNRVGLSYKANYLWDKFEYILGEANSDNVTESGNKKLQKFILLVRNLLNRQPSNKNLRAIGCFYSKYASPCLTVSSDPLWEDLKSSGKNISFLIEGETIIAAEDKEIWDLALQPQQSREENNCLILGIKGPIARLHTTIKLTKDTGPIVSFQKKSGYDSYGKQQGYNAPICEEAEFAYTTALNTMLRRDSRNKFTVGNRTFVFWASSNDKAAEQAEESLFDLLGYSEEKKDNPNAKIEQVRKVFTAIYSGSLNTSVEDRFYILGLAPNSARIAVVYWSETPLRDFAGKILRHFDDMEIIVEKSKGQKPYMGIEDMLSAVTRHGNDGKWRNNIIPNLSEAIVKSIFQGEPYPFTLFSACVRRIRAESSNKGYSPIAIEKAAILKAYLNRIMGNNEKIKVMLDQSNNNSGYLCGRLFAVLENLQYAANKQDSIRSGYMNAASSTPSIVFPTILKLSNSHYSKLAKDKKGLAIFFDNQKKEIMDMIQRFPDTLNLNDQGRFFLGYYHQKNYQENNKTEE
uniref:type I-C CRISPR-associated protein Cas8c/Csd1 n=1 Tax=Candidatus Cryptobacteroides bacterium TaxID=3085639 RepID=UPI0040286530